MKIALEIEALRAELARQALTTDNEELLKKALNLFRKAEKGSKTSAQVPGLTYDSEERIMHLSEDIAEYKAGKSNLLSHDDFTKEAEEW